MVLCFFFVSAMEVMMVRVQGRALMVMVIVLAIVIVENVLTHYFNECMQT